MYTSPITPWSTKTVRLRIRLKVGMETRRSCNLVDTIANPEWRIIQQLATIKMLHRISFMQELTTRWRILWLWPQVAPKEKVHKVLRNSPNLNTRKEGLTRWRLSSWWWTWKCKAKALKDCQWLEQMVISYMQNPQLHMLTDTLTAIRS